MIDQLVEKYTHQKGDNDTGLPNKFTVTGNLKNTSSGKPTKGATYFINAGDKKALKAVNVSDDKDWFIVTTPILKLAFGDNIVKAVK
jgi:hypothetical protein